ARAFGVSRGIKWPTNAGPRFTFDVPLTIARPHSGFVVWVWASDRKAEPDLARALIPTQESGAFQAALSHESCRRREACRPSLDVFRRTPQTPPVSMPPDQLLAALVS